MVSNKERKKERNCIKIKNSVAVRASRITKHVSSVTDNTNLSHILSLKVIILLRDILRMKK